MPMKKFSILVLFTAACGSSPKKNDPLPGGVYSVITVDSSTPSESKSYSFTTLFNCKFDGNTGTFNASFNSGTNSNLSVKIRGFSKSNNRYICRQAVDNQKSPDVGSYFDGCGISLTIPNSDTTTSTFNKYATYRTDSEVNDFSYKGACTVDVTFTDPATVSGVVGCADLLQTHLKSKVRNPVDPNVKTSLTGKSSFSCTI
jgi:hypothetical protein